MVGLFDSIDQRTSLVGQNRLEMLLFHLEAEQVYGINVFKVREILRCPKLVQIAESSPAVKGITNIRGSTICVIDLNEAIGYGPVESVEDCDLVITEYNRSVQGFVVRHVDHIVNLNWDSIRQVPKSAGEDHYLTSVTQVDDKIVEIIDVEKVLSRITPMADTIQDPSKLERLSSELDLIRSQIVNRVLIVEDSIVARNQVRAALEGVGLEVVEKTNGKQALDHLVSILDGGERLQDHYDLMISDVEMPELDGYSLVSSLRNDARTKGFIILLHTSLSGGCSDELVDRVGADELIVKCKPEDLAEHVVEKLKRSI